MAKEKIDNYPLPPKVEKVTKKVKVIFNGETIAESNNAIRILQKGLLPSYYVPKKDIKMNFFTPTDKVTTCQYKGHAHYFDITVGDKTAKNSAFQYSEPKTGYENIENYISFYPSKMDEVYVGDEKVDPKIGVFTAEWYTSDVEKPEKYKK
ncbi:DUF427 domain-containing protein [Geotoga petraea]|uniref:DUF427 domain-containing protein n=1 Tax=Geotoga petraea TaxID=28234 RepID=A0A4Z0W3V0_9BACT|nr:DUF427 domain-containing protein [Geotoga petraea]TGG89289.1 DUF427 domain-containing protein [Geotoga petraea]